MARAFRRGIVCDGSCDSFVFGVKWAEFAARIHRFQQIRDNRASSRCRPRFETIEFREFRGGRVDGFLLAARVKFVETTNVGTRERKRRRGGERRVKQLFLVEEKGERIFGISKKGERRNFVDHRGDEEVFV